MAIGSPSPAPVSEVIDILPYRSVPFTLDILSPFPEGTRVFIVGNFKATSSEPHKGWEENVLMTCSPDRKRFTTTIPDLQIGQQYEYKIIIDYPDGRKHEWPGTGIGNNYICLVGPGSSVSAAVTPAAPVTPPAPAVAPAPATAPAPAASAAAPAVTATAPVVVPPPPVAPSAATTATAEESATATEESATAESPATTPGTPNFFRRHWKWLLLAAAAIGGGAALVYKNYSDEETKDALDQAAQKEADRLHEEYLFSPKPEITVSGTVTRVGNNLAVKLDSNEIEADNCRKPHPARVVLSDDTPKYLGHGVLESRTRIQVNAHGKILEFELERPLRADENPNPFTLPALNVTPSS